MNLILIPLSILIAIGFGLSRHPVGAVYWSAVVGLQLISMYKNKT